MKTRKSSNDAGFRDSESLHMRPYRKLGAERTNAPGADFPPEAPYLASCSVTALRAQREHHSTASLTRCPFSESALNPSLDARLSFLQGGKARL